MLWEWKKDYCEVLSASRMVGKTLDACQRNVLANLKGPGNHYLDIGDKSHNLTFQRV